MDRIDAFIADLEELSRKHGLRIVDGSCGCCGYTALVDVETHEHVLGVDDWDDTRLRKAL